MSLYQIKLGARAPLIVRRFRKPGLPPPGYDAQGSPINYAAAIPPDGPAAPFKAGRAYYDSTEDLVYRCVSATVSPIGWAPTEFWQDRWKIQHRDVVELARRGLLDAVVYEGSQVRRYRCRNEAALRQSRYFQRMCERAQSRHDRAHMKPKVQRREDWRAR